MEELTRLFVAVELPDEVRHLLASVLASQVEGHVDRRLVPPRNWHLTLRFLGPTDPVTAERLMAELDQADLGPGFGVELAGLGTFPAPRRATVLWVGIDTGRERLSELAAITEEAATGVGFEPEERPFRPHLTVARLRPAVDLRALLRSAEIPKIGFEVDSIVLMESSLGGGPARYRAVERFGLGI